MSAEPNITQPSLIVRFVRFTVRLILILIVGGALGAGLFYGASTLYQQYARVVEEHALRLDTLESQQTQMAQLASDRLADFQARLEALEIQGDSDKADLADLQSRLSALEALQATLLTETEALAESLATTEQLVDDVRALGKNQTVLQGQVESITQALGTLEVQSADWQALQDDMQMLRAMQLLTRARLHLMGDNFTLASADIAAGREILAALGAQVPEHQIDTVNASVALLDEALASLPDSPVAAADKLEGAWALLVALLPSEEL